LDRLSRELSLLAEPARGAEESVPDIDASQSGGASALARYWQLLLAGLESGRSEIARWTEETLEQRLFQGGPGLRRFLEPGAELRRVLWRPLAEASRQSVLRRVREISCRMAGPGTGTDGLSGNDFVGLLASAIEQEGEPARSDVMGRILILPTEV